MPAARNDRLYKTAGYYAAFVAVGLAAAALGPTLPSLAEHTRTQLSEISFLFLAHSLGYLGGSFFSGRLYDRVPGHRVMVAGLLVMAVMLALVPVVPLLWLLTLVVLLLGVATGALDVGGNALLVWVHGRQVGPYMNGLHFFFGFGAFVAPIIIAQAVSLSGDIVWAYWVLALLMLPAAVWLIRLPSPAVPTSPEVEPVPSRSAVPPLSRPRSHERVLVVLIVLLLGLYVGAEAGFGGWIYTYALTLGLGSVTTAAYLTSVFWGALTLGRLLGIPIAARFRPRLILLADLLGCLISVAILILGWNSWMATLVGTFGLGFSMASFFPTTISLAERRVTITGQITGWFLVGASLGGMFLPWLIGQFFESIGPGSAMVVIALDLVAALGVYGVLMSYSTRHLSLQPSGSTVSGHDDKPG
jgi:FHS family Na+ dependent glucose MFS transporter 1